MKRQRERKETGFAYEKTENGKAKEMETMTRRKNGKYRGAGCRITAMIAAMATVLGCMAAMTVSAGTAGDDAAWLENRSSKTTYEEYVAHDAVSLYGDFNNDNRGDIEDVLLAYLAASGERDPRDVRYSSEDVTPSFRVHGRFEPPCDEWNRVHGRRTANPGYIDCLYEPLALYFRVCAGAECPYDGPDEGVTTTTTTAETTATEPTENRPSEPEWDELFTPEEEKVAKLVFDEINELRAEQGYPKATWDPSLAKEAQYRSKQILTNFSHDPDDMMEAAALFGHDVTSETEAIGGAACFSPEPFEEAARVVAEDFKNSPMHWSYVGTQSYMGIGCTYGIGVYGPGWYVCIIGVRY